MILSEFAGAAQSLNGSIVVNPWDSQQVANAIHEAVTMDPETRGENHKKLFKVKMFLSYLTLNGVLTNSGSM
jgi:trehalose 6-phosphate synthase